MSATRVYPPEMQARTHVFEPLDADGQGAGAHGKGSRGKQELAEIQRKAYEKGLESGKALAVETLSKVVAAFAQGAKQLDDERRARLQQAVGQLVEADRDVVLLRFYGGLSFREIAETLEQPLGTVLWRARQALDKLGRKMSAEVPGE